MHLWGVGRDFNLTVDKEVLDEKMAVESNLKKEKVILQRARKSIPAGEAANANILRQECTWNSLGMAQFARESGTAETREERVGDVVRGEKCGYKMGTDHLGSLRPVEGFWLFLLVKWLMTGRFYTRKSHKMT